MSEDTIKLDRRAHKLVTELLNERLRAKSKNLLDAIDDMHGRGETFTARVSLAVAELREALT